MSLLCLLEKATSELFFAIFAQVEDSLLMMMNDNQFVCSVSPYLFLVETVASASIVLSMSSNMKARKQRNSIETTLRRTLTSLFD